MRSRGLALLVGGPETGRESSAVSQASLSVAGRLTGVRGRRCGSPRNSGSGRGVGRGTTCREFAGQALPGAQGMGRGPGAAGLAR